MLAGATPKPARAYVVAPVLDAYPLAEGVEVISLLMLNEVEFS
ncbi:hypothetical protein [Georgfuchsia toluolica]|nr:hypothetical protein [Georgfuchsia toluolica]